MLFLIGAAAFPLTRLLFHAWFDQGYLFSKAVGLAVIGWLVFVFGMARIAPFTIGTILMAIGILFAFGFVLNRLLRTPRLPKSPIWKTILVEELFFFVALLLWTWVKAHEPSIRGLEKFMDYGFMQSILNSSYFPPVDMWYPPHSINYYYFGHLVTAMVTKASNLDLSYTFNLMLSTIFALCFTMSFSIGRELTKKISGGLFTAFLVTLAGNMQTIYAFTNGYTGDNVKPFWNLGWTLKGIETYWYANATRFIPFTIHEFPSYSFVVSDVHGHVLSIPFVLLAIALLLQGKIPYIFYGFLCGVLLMTNALDGPIYFGLFCVVLAISNIQSPIHKWKALGIAIVVALFTSLPFLVHFTSFVNGIAVNCPPSFLAHTKIGPLLFEGVEKCQRSPFWMMSLLWGFFWVSGGLWIGYIRSKKFTHIEKLLMIFFFFSIALTIFPEFFYFKDIYPQHFRSNTMFKLGYEAFILFSIVSGYAIVSLWRKKMVILLLIPLLFLVSIYPFFSVRSYFGGLKNYEGVYGLSWLEREYPDDFAAIQWLKDQKNPSVLVEADGDSYTDYQRFSTFTGIPTVVGWAVHEWLWRGSYDVVSPRREDVRRIYESEDLTETKELLNQYNVRYIIVGILERQKFTKLVEDKFTILGQEVLRSGETVIYEIDY